MLIIRHKEFQFILIKGTIHQEEITNTNRYVPNVGMPNVTKTLLEKKAQIDPKAITAGHISTS
jgi:hypothetical protein